MAPAPRRGRSCRARPGVRSGVLAVGLAASLAVPLTTASAAPAPVTDPTAPATVASTGAARTDAVGACLDPARPIVDADPAPIPPWPGNKLDVEAGTTVDARGSVLDNTALDEQGFGLGLRLRGGYSGQDVCVVGGTVRTDLDPEGTSWDTWHRVTAMPIESADVRVVGTTFRNQGDVLAFLSRAADWHVIGVRVDGGAGLPGGYAHDDCIENDSMHSGVVEDSKFDGCFNFLSATHASEKAADGSGNEVVIQGTLVRLQPYRNSFDVEKYGEGHHSGFFKLPTGSAIMVPPRLVVLDSVFRADTPARYGGNAGGLLGLPPGSRCERVTLVGTESWPAEELASWQDQCTDLHLGTVEDWDAAVEAWDAAHPPLRDLAGSGRDALGSSLGF